MRIVLLNHDFVFIKTCLLIACDSDIHAIKCINGSKYEDGVANCVDPDQTAPREQSDLSLHCLLRLTCLSTLQFLLQSAQNWPLSFNICGDNSKKAVWKTKDNLQFMKEEREKENK